MPQYRLGEGPYGSAYRGEIYDIAAAGDLAPVVIDDRPFGLFLGRFDWEWSYQTAWYEAGRGIWAWFTKSATIRTHKETIGQTLDLRFTGDQHHLVVAGTGAGKFRDALSNMLLFDGSCETSCLIIDPKGEIATKIGPMIDDVDTTNQRTLILDPWDVCGTGSTEAITFLEGLTPDNPHCVKDARILADAIIVHREGDGGHWDTTAKNFLTALLLYLATDPIEEDTRHLRRLRELVTMPWSVPEGSGRESLNGLLEYLAGSAMFGGIVGRSVQAFLNREPKERSYILSTIERDTEFVEDPALWKALDKTSVDLRQLVLSNKRLHVVLPFDYITPMRSWLRLAIATYYNACLRHALPETFPKYLKFRHIVIDEFASLGKLDFMVRDIAEARGAGIKHHLVVQNFSQLKGLYGDVWENFVSNSFVHAFGVADVFTSEYLSKLTGQATVVTETRAVGQSTSETRSSGQSTNSGSKLLSSTSGTSSSSSNSSSTTVTNTFSTTGRPVLMADEIRRIDDRHQLLFIRGMPVLLAQRAPYYEIFRSCLARHALKDMTIFRKQLTGPSGPRTGLVYSPFYPSDRPRANAQRRAAANSRFRDSDFKTPPYRSQSFREALRSDALMVGIVCSLLLGGAAVAIKSSIDASREAARQAILAAEREEKRRADEAQQKAFAEQQRKADNARKARMLPRPEFTAAPQKVVYSPEWCRYFRSLIDASKPYCTPRYAAQDGAFMAYLMTRAYIFCNEQEPSIQVMHPGNYRDTLDAVRAIKEIRTYNSQTRTSTTDYPARMNQLLTGLLNNGMAYPAQVQFIDGGARALYGNGCPFGAIEEDRYYPPPRTE